MTLSRWSRVVETAEGTGEVRRDGERVAEVSYSLRVEIKEVVAKTFGGIPKARWGQERSINGNISVSGGDICTGDHSMASSGLLTLVMDDGRELAFHVVEHDPVRGEYLIRGSGDFRQTG